MVNRVDTMIEEAKRVIDRAYAPYSRYHVASSLYSEDDLLFTGVNVENASYGLSICAESAAICQMIAAGKRIIKSLVVLNDQDIASPPCGACRQRIIEFATKDTLIYVCSFQKVLQVIPSHKLLPYAFRFNANLDLK